MNRETIEKAAQSYCDNKPYVETVLNKNAFIAGAHWRINSVWHDVKKEQPKADKPYLAVIELPQATEYAIWQGFANHPFWTKWAYLEDLIPDRKEAAQ